MHWSKVVGIAGLGGLVSCTVFAWILLATGDAAPMLMPVLSTSCLLCVGAVVGYLAADAAEQQRGQGHGHEEPQFAPIGETEV